MLRLMYESSYTSTISVGLLFNSQLNLEFTVLFIIQEPRCKIAHFVSSKSIIYDMCFNCIWASYIFL